MNAGEEVLLEVFTLLHTTWVEGVDEPTRFVGMQGNSIIIFQKGGEHVALTLVPVTIGVGA